MKKLNTQYFTGSVLLKCRDAHCENSCEVDLESVALGTLEGEAELAAESQHEWSDDGFCQTCAEQMEADWAEVTKADAFRKAEAFTYLGR